MKRFTFLLLALCAAFHATPSHAATTFLKAANFGESTLSTAMDGSTTSVVLSTGGGSQFPGTYSYRIVIDNEVMTVTNKSSDTLTVTRAAESTAAASHAAGQSVILAVTAGYVTELQTAINGVENGTTTLAKVITSGSAANTHTVDDSGTNTSLSILELYHTSSGTPAAGLGSKIVMGAEDSAGNSDGAVELQGNLSTVTSTSEQGAFLLRLKNAGTLQDALAVSVGSNSATVGSNQTTANLWNSTATTVNAFGAASTLTMGAAAGTISTGATIFKSTDATQFKIQHAPASGQALVRFSPIPTGSSAALVDFFRETSTAGAVSMELKKGDNTNTNIFRFLCGSSPSFAINNASGTQQFLFDNTTGNLTMEGGLTTKGNNTIGDASTDTTTNNGRMILRSVTDAGPMTATAGTVAEVVYNTSNSKFYGCVTTGSPATWSALN